MKGTEFTKKDGDIQKQMDSEYLYLGVSILGKGTFSIGKVGLNPFGGIIPSVNILSDYEESRVDPSNPLSEYDVTVDTKERVRTLDLGITAGVEIEIPLKRGALLWDMRNTTSVLNAEFNPRVEAYHTAFSFMIGYRFGL